MIRFTRPLLAAALVALLAAACAPIQPAAPAGDGPGDDGPLPVTITGTLSYRERMALPAGATVTLTLLDPTFQPIAVESFQTTGEQPPIPFALKVDRALVDPTVDYLLAARIQMKGAQGWVLGEPVPVRLDSNLAPVDLMLERNTEEVIEAAPPPDFQGVSGYVGWEPAAPLPEDALVTVQMVAGDPAVVVAETRFDASGAPPLYFELYVDAPIDPALDYRLVAFVEAGGEPLYTAGEAVPALVGGVFATNALVEVIPTGRAATDTPTGILTGTVTYLPRIALPAGATVTVRLQDISRMDTAALLVAEQVIVTQGEQVPIPYSLTYDPAELEERATYAVSARIEVEGALRFISDTIIPVLTRGAPLTGVEVLVAPVR